MRLPKRDMHERPEDYERALTRSLERRFDREIKEDDVGRIDVFCVALPDTHLLADGSEFLVESAPQLARKLGDTFGSPSDALHCVLPDLVAANPWGADTVVGVKK